jgi:hypothetical protein
MVTLDLHLRQVQASRRQHDERLDGDLCAIAGCVDRRLYGVPRCGWTYPPFVDFRGDLSDYALCDGQKGSLTVRVVSQGSATLPDLRRYIWISTM